VCVCVCVFARLDCSASLIQFHFDFGISDLPMPMAAQIANQIVGQIFNRVNMFMPNQAISFKHTPHDEALVPRPLCVCVWVSVCPAPFRLRYNAQVLCTIDIYYSILLYDVQPSAECRLLTELPVWLPHLNRISDA